MRDTETMLTKLGVLPSADGEPVESGEDAPRAVATPPTSDDTPGENDEDASLSLDDAWAELDGEPAPQNHEAAADSDASVTEPEDDEVARLRAENEAFKAEKALLDAQKADETFETTWTNHYNTCLNWYDDIEDDLRARGEKAGASIEQVEAVIRRIVDKGDGLTDPQTGKPVMGRSQWYDENRAAEAVARKQFYSKKTPVDTFTQVVQKYNLDEADQTSLKKFVTKLSSQDLEAMAETFAAKNSRLTTTQQQAKQDAVKNVRQRVAGISGPGTPTRATVAPPKSYEFTHDPRVKRQETEYVLARGFGLRLPPTG